MSETDSASHQQAFSDLSMIERTVLDFLENLKEGADSELQASIDRVMEAIVSGA